MLFTSFAPPTHGELVIKSGRTLMPTVLPDWQHLHRAAIAQVCEPGTRMRSNVQSCTPLNLAPLVCARVRARSRLCSRRLLFAQSSPRAFSCSRRLLFAASPARAAERPELDSVHFRSRRRRRRRSRSRCRVRAWRSSRERVAPTRHLAASLFRSRRRSTHLLNVTLLVPCTL